MRIISSLRIFLAVIACEIIECSNFSLLGLLLSLLLVILEGEESSASLLLLLELMLFVLLLLLVFLLLLFENPWLILPLFAAR